MSEFTDQAKENLDKMQELNMLKKVTPNAQKLKTFLYTNDVNLREQISYIYPESTHIIIVNLDKRDGLGIPTISTRQTKVRYVTSTLNSGKKYVSSNTYTEIKVILCLVEHDVVSVKVVTRNASEGGYY